MRKLTMQHLNRNLRPMCRVRRLGGKSVLLVLALGVAAPASSAELWKWVGEDGSISYTDEVDRVPARHRAAATQIETGGLGGYARFTAAETPSVVHAPSQAPATHHYAIGRPMLPAVSAPPPSVGVPEAVVQVNDSTSIRVPADSGPRNEGPLVVEEVRVRRKGSNFTTHDTVVRRGDDVLIVVRPAQGYQGRPSDVVDEADLLE